MFYYNYNNTYIHIYINECINKLNYHFFFKCKNRNTSSFKNLMKYKFIPLTLTTQPHQKIKFLEIFFEFLICSLL